MKASETILIFLMAGLMLSGCNDRSDHSYDLVTIDVNEALKTNGELKLSDLDKLSKMKVSQPDLRDELVDLIKEAYEEDLVLIIMKIRD
jgi:hypothetical protein